MLRNEPIGNIEAADRALCRPAGCMNVVAIDHVGPVAKPRCEAERISIQPSSATLK
jgi:hypothetical protein